MGGAIARFCAGFVLASFFLVMTVPNSGGGGDHRGSARSGRNRHSLGVSSASGHLAGVNRLGQPRARISTTAMVIQCPGSTTSTCIARVTGPFIGVRAQFTMFDGSVGLFGVFPYGQVCGRLVSVQASHCSTGFGDPYLEVAWSRSFGQLRPSRYPGAFPIMQGLAVMFGLGAVLPLGKYDRQLQASNGISMGNNTFDLAPSVAVTYTTPPLIFEGTEFSAKFYWNNYRTNPDTQYKAGSLLDVDFAISEHIGRFQVGAAGIYAFQVEDDRQFGVSHST